MFIQGSAGFSASSFSGAAFGVLGLTAEQRLVVFCSQLSPSDGNFDKGKHLLGAVTDWSAVARLANDHGVLPLLFWNLKSHLRELVPSAVFGNLKKAFYLNAGHNLALARELGAVIKLLAEHGIQAASLKGPCLAAVAYGSLSFRQFGDLDVLVCEKDARRAKQLLQQRGYVDKFGLSESQDRVFQNTNHTFNLFRDDDGSIVELHWRLFPDYFSVSYPVDELLERSPKVSLLGSDVPTPGIEDLLLILCIHGTKHAWDRLSLAVDVAQLLKSHGQLDWGRLRDMARRVGATRMLLSGVALARELWEAPLPETILCAVDSDQDVRKVTLRARSHLFSGHDLPEGPFARLPFHLACRERVRDRYHYLSRFLFNPALDDLEFFRLPPRLSFLYPPLRVFRLFVVDPVLALMPPALKKAAKRLFRRSSR